METPFFTYQGSKASLRKWIIPYMPSEGNHYIEPFAGRANMFFLAKQNLNFKWWTLNDPYTYAFLEAVKHYDGGNWMPETMTWELYQEYKSRWEENKEDPQVLILEPGTCHLGHVRSGWMGKYVKTRKWNKREYHERVQAAKKLLEKAFICGVDWWKLELEEYSNKDFIYFDPPYLDTEHRYYENIRHGEFVEVIKRLKCRWLLSHTDHPFYREHLGEPIATKTRKPGGKAMGKIAGKQFVECLWANYKASS